jgi:hypothetical protein
MERTRVWHGRVKPEARAEHEDLNTRHGTDAAKVQYAKYLLTGYTLAQHDDGLTILLSSEEPPAIIRFLRNPRMWPEIWEFLPGSTEVPELPEKEVRIRWRKA